MKASVLKANETAALKCWEDFKAMNEKPDWKNNGVEFRKKDIAEIEGVSFKKGSFEIRYTKMVDGVRKGRTIFRFLKKEIGNEVQWDERFVTI